MSAIILTHSDQELIQHITQRLYWDKRISLSDVKIKALQGVVYVSGTLDSRFKKEACLEIIYATDGVWSVEDHLKVRPGQMRTDLELKTILEQQLKLLCLPPEEKIKVTVSEGVVRLSGRVYHRRSKALADGMCWELSGVRDCFNLIILNDPPPGIPAERYICRHLANLSSKSEAS